MKSKKSCPSCKGKGHIMDAGIMLLPVVGWIMAWAERNDKNGLTRDTCGQCNGRGYIEW